MDKTTKCHTDAQASWCEQPLDVLVIGGGIVGAGVARDAAMRGLHTGLVEQRDFGFGTSSRSSRLLHGGIRYLAQGRLGLVWEASREKTILRQIAPHLAQPLPFLFPTWKKNGWPRWKLAIGVKLYDLMCAGRNFGHSRRLSRAETLDRLPGLAPNGLTGAVRYFDGLTNDARLVLDTLRSAATHGAQVRNYVRFVNATAADGQWDCTLQSAGVQSAGPASTWQVRAKCVVNATGPWSDQLPIAKTSLRLTKGVHLVVQRDRLPVPEAVVMAVGDRVLFAIPWGERVILGTTDTDFKGPIEQPVCDEDDTRYVLDVVNRTFPDARLDISDVISHWAGLRPLVADSHGNPSDISRRHEITMSHPGWWDVTGGKLTTYRLMAEETIDAIVNHLDVAVARSRTASVPLVPPPDDQRTVGILPPEVNKSAVQHFCRREWARHVDDVMIRRTSWRYYHRDHLEIAARVAPWMAEELAWSSEQMWEELSRYRQIVGAGVVPAPNYGENLQERVVAESELI